MAAERIDTHAPEIEWDSLAVGGEVSATVLMASGFVLPRGSQVRERYRVVGALGEGMMGQVLAVQLLGHEDEQTYALKMVARRTDDANDDEAESQATAYAALLRQEAAKQDIVQRHGIAVARLFALVQLDDGAIGMRMECARGRSLEAWLDHDRETPDAPPDVFRAVSAVRKLVSQLRRLHEIVDPGSPQGFVHCDIKPGNVFVDDADANDLQVTLLDFGVATAGQALAHGLVTGPRGRHTFIMQETGGTLGYAPPGHFMRKATPLSDIHASLVILFELIALGLPWPLADTGDAYGDVIDLEGRMRTPPRSVRAVRPSVPTRDAVVLDDFFRREFAALHRLNDEVASQPETADASARRATTTQLAQLARQYQRKLDELCSRFPHSAVRPGHAGPEAREPTRIQRVVVLGEGDTHDAAKTGAEEKHALPPARTGLMIVGPGPSANPDATGALPLVRSTQQRPETPARPPARVPPPTASEAAKHSLPPVPLVRKPVVRPAREVAASTPKGLLLLKRMAPLLAIVVGGFVAYAALRARSAPVAGGEVQRSVCFAPHPGVRVSARGGALISEVVVCSVAAAAPSGGFTGTGTIPLEVSRAVPRFECIGGPGPMDIVVAEARTGGEVTTTFRCRLR